MRWRYAMVAVIFILGSDAVKPKDMQKWCTNSEARKESECDQSEEMPGICSYDVLTYGPPVVMHFPSSGYEEIEECQIRFHPQPKVLMRRRATEQIECGWVMVTTILPGRAKEYDLCDTEMFEHQHAFVVNILHKTGKMAAFNITLTGYTNAWTCAHSDELCCQIESDHMCDTNRCVSLDSVCDGVEGCVDGGDEGRECCEMEGYQGEGCVVEGGGGKAGCWWGVVFGVAVLTIWR